MPSGLKLTLTDPAVLLHTSLDLGYISLIPVFWGRKIQYIGLIPRSNFTASKQILKDFYVQGLSTKPTEHMAVGYTCGACQQKFIDIRRRSGMHAD